MFRLSIISIAMITISASSVYAASDCGPRPEKPSLPSGATAQIEAMKSSSTAIDQYADQMNKYADCLIEAAQGVIDERNDIVQQWNGEIDAFNKRLTSE